MKKQFRFISVLLLLASLWSGGCGGAYCVLPEPFCGSQAGFTLNTQQTTAYGPAWADVVTSASDWIACYGPYALCYYANCVATPGSHNQLADCPCFEAFGTNYVDINAILNNDVYNDTVAYCATNDCTVPNAAPVCDAIISGSLMYGASTFSTFSFYRATEQPIGLTDCSSQPGRYAGCMTAPCFGQSTLGEDSTTLIQCQCPIYDGPFQVGSDNLSCDDRAKVYSAAYNVGTPTPPADKCAALGQCIPDAPVEDCGCGLYVPGTTVLPPGSDVDCVEVCNEYNTCQRTDTGVQLGYTCDATLCTSGNQKIIADACLGLQNCNLSEIFKAEAAADCSCCASQLCGCDANTATEFKIGSLNSQQQADGTSTQCEINGTLCGQ
jgi:hypothetical protein